MGYCSRLALEARLTADQIIGTFGIALGANVLTILAIYGMVQVSKAERQTRETGEKVPVPPYVYLLIIVPGALTAACLYYIS